MKRWRNLWRPDYAVERVTDLTPDKLAAWGIASLLLDVDCTLKPYRATNVADDVAAWLATMYASKITLCLISNGRPERIAAFAESVSLPFVAIARKPLPFKCREAVRVMQFVSERTALVGDQLFTDIVAANLCGLTSILVDPISPEQEPWFARIKRPLERLVGRTARPHPTNPYT
ncbi:MAG: YqeG family HAD IIIA-type phosphatase [Thermoguttaceae bacterium]